RGKGNPSKGEAHRRNGPPPGDSEQDRRTEEPAADAAHRDAPLRDLAVDDDRSRAGQARGRGNPQDRRVGKWVAGDSLQKRPGNGQRSTHDHAIEQPRIADLPHDVMCEYVRIGREARPNLWEGEIDLAV